MFFFHLDLKRILMWALPILRFSATIGVYRNISLELFGLPTEGSS